MPSRFFLLNTATAAALRRQVIAPTTRGISTTARLSLKESESTDPNPDEFERHKQDSLEKQRQGKGHWKSELASVSEESVKADRQPGDSSKESIKKLQDQTKGDAEERRKHGTSMRDL